MYDREHDIEQTLLRNSEEGVIVVQHNLVHEPNDPMIDHDIINVEDIDDFRIESNDNMSSTGMDEVAIDTNGIRLRQPVGPSGMVEEILRQVPVEEDLPSAVTMSDVVQPNEPAVMVEELLRPLAFEEEIVLFQPNLSVHSQKQKKN